MWYMSISVIFMSDNHQVSVTYLVVIGIDSECQACLYTCLVWRSCYSPKLCVSHSTFSEHTCEIGNVCGTFTSHFSDICEHRSFLSICHLITCCIINSCLRLMQFVCHKVDNVFSNRLVTTGKHVYIGQSVGIQAGLSEVGWKSIFLKASKLMD